MIAIVQFFRRTTWVLDDIVFLFLSATMRAEADCSALLFSSLACYHKPTKELLRPRCPKRQHGREARHHPSTRTMAVPWPSHGPLCVPCLKMAEMGGRMSWLNCCHVKGQTVQPVSQPSDSNDSLQSGRTLIFCWQRSVMRTTASPCSLCARGVLAVCRLLRCLTELTSGKWREKEEAGRSVSDAP